MNLKIDSPTLALWKTTGVDKISISFVAGGCSGTKIAVDTVPSPSWPKSSVTVGDTVVHFEESDRIKLENARLTRVEKNGKTVWLYVSEGVKGRCGCGSSFSFDSDSTPVSKHVPNPKFDIGKIASLKAKFQSGEAV